MMVGIQLAQVLSSIGSIFVLTLGNLWYQEIYKNLVIIHFIVREDEVRQVAVGPA